VGSYFEHGQLFILATLVMANQYYLLQVFSSGLPGHLILLEVRLGDRQTLRVDRLARADCIPGLGTAREDSILELADCIAGLEVGPAES
jgi:hypothetical protein